MFRFGRPCTRVEAVGRRGSQPVMPDCGPRAISARKPTVRFSNRRRVVIINGEGFARRLAIPIAKHRCRAKHARNLVAGTGAALVALVLAGAPGFAATQGEEERNDIIGQVRFYQVREGETLLDIARLTDMGFIEMVAANPGVDPWLPAPGRTVLVPGAHLLPDAPRKGIVINLPELRLYYYGDGSVPPVSYPIGIGRLGRETPLGATAIVTKRVDPVWTPPDSIRAERPDLPQSVPPGPENPLGAYAMNLGWRNYVIHGTNKPYGIGRRVSSGCIRMYPEDIERLFQEVQLGTPVTVLDQPVKLGWSEGHIHMEVHPSVEEGDELEARGWFTPAAVAGLREQVGEFAGADAARIYWPAVHRAAQSKRGIPVRITR